MLLNNSVSNPKLTFKNDNSIIVLRYKIDVFGRKINYEYSLPHKLRTHKLQWFFK